MRLLRQFSTFYYFLTTRFYKYKKAQNRLQRTKIKNAYKNHIREQSHLFAYLRFVLLLGCALMLLVLLVFFVRATSFRKKIKSLTV